MKFEVGQRVRVYGPGLIKGIQRYATPGFTVWVGVVVESDFVQGKQEQVCVKFSTGYTEYWLHPKQCRLLKKRERRRVWINEIDIPLGGMTMTRAIFSSFRDSADMNPALVEFIEVPRKK